MVSLDLFPSFISLIVGISWRLLANIPIGFLYDVFIYTGPDSPINTPWWGLRDLFKGGRFGGDGRGLVQAEAELREKSDKDMV